jgi:hypothetical protein
LLFKAQDKVFVFSNSHAKTPLDFRFNSFPLMNLYSLKSINTTSIKTQSPKLPFFCSMEEKCRSKFNFFLKLRAGNDESYMKMIAPSSH